MTSFTHTYCTHMGRVPHSSFSLIKEWTHITGSQQTFYRPIDIALLWHGEVIVRKEFLTVFMDMLNLTCVGLKARLKCYLDGRCAEWEHPLDWSHSVFLLCPAVLSHIDLECLVTESCLHIINVFDIDAKGFNIFMTLVHCRISCTSLLLSL